jgi:hypothetical protein
LDNLTTYFLFLGKNEENQRELHTSDEALKRHGNGLSRLSGCPLTPMPLLHSTLIQREPEKGFTTFKVGSEPLQNFHSAITATTDYGLQQPKV